MLNFPKSTAFLCGALLLATSGAGYSQTGSGLLWAHVYATASDLVVDQPASLQQIPGMSVEIVAAEPVLVRFCGAVNMIDVGQGGSMRVAPFLDGGLAGSSIQFAVDTVRLPHCFTWVLEGFAAGAHTVSIAWETTGNELVIQDRTLTVEGTLRSAAP